jgi:hypothetical protein
MAFFRIVQRANGRRYLYEEVRWREGGKVRSRSRSLGPVDGGRSARKRRWSGIISFIEAQRLSPEDRVLAGIAKEAERIERYQREQFGETAQEAVVRERQELLDKLHAAYGLRLGPLHPTPIEKQPALNPGAIGEASPTGEPAAEPIADSNGSTVEEEGGDPLATAPLDA